MLSQRFILTLFICFITFFCFQKTLMTNTPTYTTTYFLLIHQAQSQNSLSNTLSRTLGVSQETLDDFAHNGSVNAPQPQEFVSSAITPIQSQATNDLITFNQITPNTDAVQYFSDPYSFFQDIARNTPAKVTVYQIQGGSHMFNQHLIENSPQAITGANFWETEIELDGVSTGTEIITYRLASVPNVNKITYTPTINPGIFENYRLENMKKKHGNYSFEAESTL